jgi:hypothetical protein
MTVLKFIDVWNNHPTVSGVSPGLDTKVYENQCAINLSYALMAAGMPLSKFHGTLSWQKDKPKLPIRAQELADWLARNPAGIPFGVRKYKHSDLYNKKLRESIFDRFPLKGDTGIVFFQNYYGVGMQGDHIDLWNGSRLTDISSWMRIHFNISIPDYASNYHDSEAVWFWPLP